jgi:hypothetical protein
MKVVNLCQQITSSAGATKISVLKVPANREIRVTELQLIIRLTSIEELAYYEQQAFIDEEQKNALFWQNALTAQSKGLTTWFRKGGVDYDLLTFLLFRRNPYYQENLLERFSGRDELLLEGGTEILLSITDQGHGLLTETDRLTIWGTYFLSDAFYE